MLQTNWIILYLSIPSKLTKCALDVTLCANRYNLALFPFLFQISPWQHLLPSVVVILTLFLFFLFAPANTLLALWFTTA